MIFPAAGIADPPDPLGLLNSHSRTARHPSDEPPSILVHELPYVLIIRDPGFVDQLGASASASGSVKNKTPVFVFAAAAGRVESVKQDHTT